MGVEGYGNKALSQQTVPPANMPPVNQPIPADVQDKLIKKERHEQDVMRLEQETKAISDVKIRLEQELKGLRDDRIRLNIALLETTQRVKDTEERLTSSEMRLRGLSTSEEALRKSLLARREVIGDVLAALQRMGRRPPPAVLVSPDDMLMSVRSAILLGAVLPELKSETQALVTDLTEMIRLRDAVAREREQIGQELVTLSQERTRLSGLIEARQQAVAGNEKNISQEQLRLQNLAAQSKDVRELVAGIDRDLSAFNRSLEESRQSQNNATRDVRQKLASASLKDPTRLAPKIAFSNMRGLLPMPVTGQLIKPFGSVDGYGVTTSGMTFLTRPQALVSAPADSWVAYSGPFRSYGKLLILNTGDGYYILLAGLGRTDVNIQQFVLAGEPLGVMGESTALLNDVIGTKTAATDKDKKQNLQNSNERAPEGAELYIEFRKDGTPIDPATWWLKTIARSPKERT